MILNCNNISNFHLKMRKIIFKVKYKFVSSYGNL